MRSNNSLYTARTSQRVTRMVTHVGAVFPHTNIRLTRKFPNSLDVIGFSYHKISHALKNLDQQSVTMNNRENLSDFSFNFPEAKRFLTVETLYGMNEK